MSTAMARELRRPLPIRIESRQVAWQEDQLSNGLLEGTNSLVQAAKRRARGYRSKDKMITIIYLIAGKLPLPEIHTI